MFVENIALKSGNVIIKKCIVNIDNEFDIAVYSLDGSLNKTFHSVIPCDISNISIMNNNTGLVIQEINKNYWTLSTIDFPKLMKGRHLLLFSFF